MNTALIRYDAACKALTAAKSTDEVRKIGNGAAMLRAYAKQAKNKQLEIDAAEIRIRAERRLGELIDAQKHSIGLAKGAKGNPRGRGAKIVRGESAPAQPTLADAGIDKDLAKRARKLAAVPEKQFERRLADWRDHTLQQSGRVSLPIVSATRSSRSKSMTDDPVAPTVILPHWSDDEEFEQVNNALRIVRELIEKWPDDRSYQTLLHEVQQLLRFIERLEARRGTEVPA